MPNFVVKMPGKSSCLDRGESGLEIYFNLARSQAEAIHFAIHPAFSGYL
jgi:hypothetical protein